MYIYHRKNLIHQGAINFISRFSKRYPKGRFIIQTRSSFSSENARKYNLTTYSARNFVSLSL